MPDRLSRREALVAGLAGAAALSLSRPAAAAEPDLGAALTALVRAEQGAVLVYRDAGLDELAGQENEHVKALDVHLQALGLPVPAPVRGRDSIGPAALGVLEARGTTERLRAAIAFEQALVDGCAARLGRLAEPGILRTVATVMASHAQHMAMHQRSAGLDPLSSVPIP